MIPVWPASLPQTPRRGSFQGGPRDERAAFTPDVGPDILRGQVTAETGLFEAVFPALDPAQVTTFETFARVTLARGTAQFAWRDPVTGLAFAWRIARGERLYDLAPRGARLTDVSLRLVRMPGPPWWQPYATPGDVLRLPFVVADYAAGVFGVDLSRVPAAAVADVSGTFDLFTTDTDGLTGVLPAEVVTAGDIPATAPSGIARIVGYA